jgi:glycine hydroxymethyltransferase
MSEPSIRIAVGADHGGVEVKDAVVAGLQAAGWAATDFGTHTKGAVDYSDFANQVAAGVADGTFDRGVLVCTSGVGMCMAANRFRGVRAANVRTVTEVELAREHNDINVLCIGANQVAVGEAPALVEAFLRGPFEGGRHERRLDKASGSRLQATDPEVFAAVVAEEQRQRCNIELIASENFASPAVMEAQGTVLTNKYAEGYPGRRWYGGCENVDVVEQLAIDRAKELFGAEHANVQPHSGSQANTAVYFSVLQAGRPDPDHGPRPRRPPHPRPQGELLRPVLRGHPLRGQPEGRADRLRRAREVGPRAGAALITVGASRLPARHRLRAHGVIAREIGAWLFVDMAHIAGLVAAGVHPNPVPHATSSPPPPTSPCAARAAGSSSARRSSPKKSTPRCSPASRAAR